jgi:hypothetical protein
VDDEQQVHAVFFRSRSNGITKRATRRWVALLLSEIVS